GDCGEASTSRQYSCSNRRMKQAEKPATSYGTTIMALAATTWIQAVVSWAMLTVPVFATSAAAELDLSPSKVGYYAGISYIGAMTGALLGGGLVPRYGAINLSQIGMVI